MIDPSQLEATLFRFSPMFRELSNAERDEVVDLFERREVPAETPLTWQGQPGAALFVIVDGEVRVEAAPEEGLEPVEVARLADGDFLGEISLFTGKAANATCTTTKDTVVYALPRDRFEELMVRFPRIQTVAAQAAIDRSAATSSKLSRQHDYGRSGPDPEAGKA